MFHTILLLWNAFFIIISQVLSSNSSLSEIVVSVNLHNIDIHYVRLVPASPSIISGGELILLYRRCIFSHRGCPFVDMLRIRLFFPFYLNMNWGLVDICLFFCFRISDHWISACLNFNIVKSSAFCHGFTVTNSVMAWVSVHMVAIRFLDFVLSEVLLVTKQFSTTLHLSSRFNQSVQDFAELPKVKMSPCNSSRALCSPT